VKRQASRMLEAKKLHHFSTSCPSSGVLILYSRQLVIFVLVMLTVW